MVALAGWFGASAVVIESVRWLYLLGVGKGTAVSCTGVVIITFEEGTSGVGLGIDAVSIGMSK